MVIVLAMCAAWSVLATAFTLQMYLPPFTAQGDGIAHMDLMVEIDCLASSLNIALPVAILAVILGVVLARRRKLPVLAAFIAAGLLLASLLPVIPIITHFDRLHGEEINILGNHVWWIPE